ncbi:DNA cytosine methyltransferase [Mycolicibacterium brumae]|uniref:DNA (cytosine-5-)-methyltransferase n=1 Tax=Mycolicibacterium brumae TaxID=85968 RepID=A0A2G5P667_9MYCO|nr:DNA cytosine methyltransferase [Mycolicibacterium brumae]MCV7194047.1 DNA cytosine methyltransferase [Mycolicibacterium brumae]PIB73756.1 DNA cytosine methyltransferase [Mycolicibacterium brumae]RWA19963.1 hypothetical protein MBRU_16225 [Mycolicibacterium brumae DSM 44177]UWW09719.1 DNA cytosine methyltransferase [Mycolicibacterium brumae]
MASDSTKVDSSDRIIDLFAGPGGLDVGAAWLGIPATGIESDENACSTRLNAGLGTVLGDVRNFGPDDFADATILTGGPPCQTFTVAGSGSGRRALDEVVRHVHELETSQPTHRKHSDFSDDRTALVLEPLRWALLAARAARPYRAIVLEQVQTVLPVWDAYKEVLERIGYNVAVGTLRAEEYGVPQTRRRAILVARLGDQKALLPEPTHTAFRKGAPQQEALDLQPWVSMGKALRTGSAFTVVSNYGSGGDPKKRGERHSAEPAATVTGKVTRNRLLHANGEATRLSHHDAGILQTFPRDYPWSGKDIGQQIGNAIPPRLGVHILAAALGIPVDPVELDRVVHSSWEAGRENPIRPTGPELQEAADARA